MSIYGYCRISTAKQADDGESLGVQQRQIEGWCMIAGETLTSTFVECGISGSMPISKRPEGSKLIATLKAGDTIVCARLDRLFRSALDALQTVETMQKRKVKIVIIDALGDITGNGMAKAFLTISAAFAELERDTIRERVTTVKADQRDRGRYLGGRVPFGYKVATDGGLEPIPNEQEIIHKIITVRRTSKSIRYIRDMLAQEYDRSLSLAVIHRIIHDHLGKPLPKLHGE